MQYFDTRKLQCSHFFDQRQPPGPRMHFLETACQVEIPWTLHDRKKSLGRSVLKKTAFERGRAKVLQLHSLGWTGFEISSS